MLRQREACFLSSFLTCDLVDLATMLGLTLLILQTFVIFGFKLLSFTYSNLVICLDVFKWSIGSAPWESYQKVEPSQGRNRRYDEGSPRPAFTRRIKQY